MGTVYEAFDALMEHRVALKCLYDIGPEDRYRLKSEFRALANIVHPNLVSLYELFASEESCFFTMECVPGKNFVSHLLPAPAETRESRLMRLRDGSRQLALAISALHHAGVLHRDIKPSNVLVTASGRVVLLDFGLAAPLTDLGFIERLAGTLDYMAPEQLSVGPLTEATDWYSFGLTLFEAVSGNLPFSGPPFEMASQKRKGAFKTPQELGLDVPEDLAGLMCRLLSPAPSGRPGAAEILELLGGEEPSGPVWIGPAVPSVRPPHFINRQSELGVLASALEDVRAGTARIVYLHGPSGIGKTDLVRAFVSRPGESQRLVLQGRCHPHESVPFNALDRVIDCLVDVLQSFTAEERLELIPDAPGPLARVFPVLESIEELGRSNYKPASGESVVDVRRRAFEALRELLSRLATRRELILAIDDLQWGDLDSGVALADLLRGPSPPAMLVLLSYRTEDRETSPCLGVLAAPDLFPPDRVTTLPLAPLGDDESLEVVRSFAGSRGMDVDRERLLNAAAGSPFLLGEIGRYLAALAADETLPSDLAMRHMLLARASRLDASEARLLEILAVAGEPLELKVLLAASGVNTPFSPMVALLERLSLLRLSGAEMRTAEIYHHRIGDEVLGTLSEADRRGHNAALAKAMVACGDTNLQKLVEHYMAAGDLEAARRYVVAAASQASTAFAFDRASQLWQLALELGATDLDELELSTRLGHALANAGRGRDAGRAFMRAANLVAASRNPDPERLLILQRSATEHFLKSGHEEEGIATLHAMLAKYGTPYPASDRSALLRATALRAAGLARGLELRGVGEVPKSTAERLDALWAVAMAIGTVDLARGSYFAARYLRESLDAGDPRHAARACAIESTRWASIPGSLFRRRATRLLSMSEHLAKETSAYERGVMLGGKSAVAWFGGDWAGTVRHADEAAVVYRTQCLGTAFEIALLDNWSFSALALKGDIRELVKRVEASARDGERRDDRLLERNSFFGQPALAWLALDRPEYVLERADRAIAWWQKGPRRIELYFYLLSKVQVLLYQGNAGTAHSLLETQWQRLARDGFLAVQCVRDELRHLRARTALAMAMIPGGQPTQHGTMREAFTRMALREASIMERHELECARAWASLIRAGVEAATGKQRPETLRDAVDRCDGAGMALHREAARYCLGVALGEKHGRSMRAQASSWFEGQGIVNPGALTRTLVPGCLPVK